MRLYGDLVDWYPLISRPEDYGEEAAHILALCAAGADGRVETLLELGCGAGHMASHLSRHVCCTLSDLSPGMLALSRGLNPGCEHIVGDMRTLRLPRRFDAVLIHDAVGYMATEADLAAANATASCHLRTGGVAIFLPDDVRDGYTGRREEGTHTAGGRTLHYVERSHPSIPGRDSVFVDFELTLKEADGTVRVENDRHVVGLFARATWRRLMEQAGLDVLKLDVDDPYPDDHAVFVGRKR